MPKTNGKIPARIAVGESVHLRLGQQSVTGTIVEDQGKLAPGGKRLYRIEMENDPDWFILATADDLRALQD